MKNSWIRGKEHNASPSNCTRDRTIEYSRPGLSECTRESAENPNWLEFRSGQCAFPPALACRKARRPATHATHTTQPRFPSENPMNISESAAPQPAYTIAGCSRQRLRA